MLSDATFNLVYSTGESEPVEFFFEALLESNRFDLGLGYFSSSGFQPLALGFAYFICRGGKMRMFINDVLTQEDKDAIEKGQYANPDELIEKRLIDDIVRLEKTLSKRDRHFFNCLSFLIANKQIEIIAITPATDKPAIAHPKFGIFKDDYGNKVAFTGSTNFSRTALQYNVEAISCYKNWTGDNSDIHRIEHYEELFNKIWSGRYTKVRFISIDKVKVLIREKFPVNDIEVLLSEEEKLLLDFEEESIYSEELGSKIRKLKRNLGKYKPITPEFPSGHKARPYQEEAVRKWIAKDYRGLFEMATGTGKTITGLLASVELMKKQGRIFLLVLVPTISLGEQWMEEVKGFNYQDVVLVSSTNPGWTSELQAGINSFKMGTAQAMAVISTYDSFKLKKFQDFYDKLPEETMLLADEAHSMGAPELLNKLPHKIKHRLALSATPHRHFDDSGTKKFLDFFNASSEATFAFDMKQAIAEQYLCQYQLTPHFASLNEDEYSRYIELTKKIARRAHFSKNKLEETDVTLERMLQDRRKILNKAASKKEIVGNIIDKMKAKGEVSHTLVYCPEGIDEEDNARIIDDLGKYLAFDKGLKIAQFTGSTPPERRSQLLKDFDEGKVQCLLAMKCLDEGVDVKRTETAIFVSSSTNPRQYVQRRGRVLRTHEEKSFAFLHDIITVPPKIDLDDPKAKQADRIILSQEFKRYKEFAEDAVNYVEAVAPVKEICKEYEIVF